MKRLIFLLFVFLILITGIYAQSEFPAGDFWSLGGGAGMSGFVTEGIPFQGILEPRLWLSPALMVGSRVGLNYSAEEDSTLNLSDILTFEGQVYLRWNFLRLGKNPARKTNIFLQGGLGLVSAYRGDQDKLLTTVTETRGSVMGDVALGITIPLTNRWYIEPSGRGGYPHLYGFSLITGYKFPLPQKTIQRTEIHEVIKTISPNEIVRRIVITAVEFVLFGPDIGRYNVGIDRDAQQLNELVLDYMAQTLKGNPNFHVRIEGHANPYTINISEADELMVLGSLRANNVADQLRHRGVSNDQIIIISFGGTRTATGEWDVRNRNRRVEMIITQIDDI